MYFQLVFCWTLIRHNEKEHGKWIWHIQRIYGVFWKALQTVGHVHNTSKHLKSFLHYRLQIL